MAINTTATQSGTEPISGQSGKGTADEPFDKGNDATLSGSEPKHTETNLTGSNTTEPTHTGSNPTESSHTGSNPTEPKLSESDLPGSSGPNHSTSITGPTDPADGADPSSGQKPFQKQQGGDRPTEAPSGEQKEAVKNVKDEGEELLKKRDPNDHSGEPMKMHDGKEHTEEAEDGDHPGQEGGTRHGEKGTGEEWVKTSGLQAEGGDFDAAKPGAGREADRLLEDKGILKDDRGALVDKEGQHVNPTDHQGGSSSGSHSKVKTMDKIKEKLHIGTGKKI